MSATKDFRSAIREGVKVGRPTVVLHARSSGSPGVRVGFVVSKAVGNAVTRNLVKRRLRHLAAERLMATPPGVDIVVRALPPAAVQPDALRRDLPSAWSSAVRAAAKRASPDGPR